MRVSRTQFHHYFYVLGLGLLLASLPLSHFAMGLLSFLLFLNWMAEWNWREKWARLCACRQGLWFSALYLVMCVGLLKTDNWPGAGQQLLSNLVVLLAPVIIISSKPITDKEMRWLFNAFIIGTFIGVAASLIYWQTHVVHEMRDISLFIDHIRFSLCVVLSIVLSVKLLTDPSGRGGWPRLAYAANILLMAFYLFVAQTLTGVVIVVVLMVVTTGYLSLRRQFIWKKQAVTVLLVLLGAIFVYVFGITYGYFHDKDQGARPVSVTTSRGNPYSFAHDGLVENGHLVHDYVCREEMAEAWALRSDSTFDAMIEATLTRYLNSKGLRKDYDAVMSLSDKDIVNVERKIANVDYTRPFGLKRALYQTYFSVSKYRLNQDIQGSSLMQRLELWGASWAVVRNNWLLGVGLGDQKAELDRELERMHSPLASTHNRGCHNQFLSYWLTGGVLLVAYFLFLLAYPFVGMRRRVSFLYTVLVILLFCSMLVEDTLGSQTGMLMFAVLLPMLLFNERRNALAAQGD